MLNHICIYVHLKGDGENVWIQGRFFEDDENHQLRRTRRGLHNFVTLKSTTFLRFEIYIIVLSYLAWCTVADLQYLA